MKSLILTEKPSVARDFAKALKIRSRNDGHFEGTDFIITWAIGHLLQLKNPEDYDKKWKKWSLDTLPIIPDRLKFRPNPKTRKQLTIIKSLLKRSDLAEVIIATDAGREGELIGRLILEDAKSKLPVKRFWTSQALTPNVVLSELKAVRPISEFNRLYLAGRARQSADWLVGMNMSRLATINFGDLFSIGRVQTAVLGLLVKRRKEIDEFVPEPYFTIIATAKFQAGTIDGDWFDPKKKEFNSRIPSKEKADAIKKSVEGKEAKLEKVEKKEHSQPPPYLFSLTQLQKTANRMYGFTAKKTLSLAQALYEKHKCLSYPRTDAQVLGEKSFSLAKKIIEKLKTAYEVDFENLDESKVSLSNRMVFNDAKLTDHHAIIPLKLPPKGLTKDEFLLYRLVTKRFIAAFSRDFKYSETKVVFVTGVHHFRTQGKKIIDLGWKSLLGADKDKYLLDVKIGEIGQLEKAEVDKKKTRPPLEYSDASLLQDMINPASLVEDSDLKRVFRGEVGIGTQSTRAQIIETLIDRGYVARNGRHLKALEKGVFLIYSLKKLKLSKIFSSPEQTAQWELSLEEVASGSGDPKAFMLNIRKLIHDCVEEWKVGTHSQYMGPKTKRSSKSKFQKGKKFEDVGTCPLCKKHVRDFPKSYSCEDWKNGCQFKVWKVTAKKKISKAQIGKLLNKGSTDSIKGFKSKLGIEFSAKLILKDGKVEFQV